MTQWERSLSLGVRDDSLGVSSPVAAGRMRVNARLAKRLVALLRHGADQAHRNHNC